MHADLALKDAVRFLILHHLRAHQYDPSWTDAAVRRFARIEELAARVQKVAEDDARIPPLPAGVGDGIMKAFGLAPSRLVGDIKRALEDAIARGEISPHQPCEAYVAFVGADRARFGLTAE